MKFTTPITLNNIIDGYKTMWGGETVYFPEELRTEMFEAVKELVASRARGKNKNRIINCPLNSLSTKGIYNRLWIETDGTAYYCAGQDYISEMGYIRKTFTN